MKSQILQEAFSYAILRGLLFDHLFQQPHKKRIQILNAIDRQAIDNQTTGAIVKREDGPLAEPPAALDL